MAHNYVEAKFELEHRLNIIEQYKQEKLTEEEALNMINARAKAYSEPEQPSKNNKISD